jgi:hypothetical protein
MCLWQNGVLGNHDVEFVCIVHVASFELFVFAPNKFVGRKAAKKNLFFPAKSW